MKRKDDKYLTPLKTIGGTDANMIAQGKLYEVWINKLNSASVPCGPIYSVDKVFADPQVKHLGLSQSVKHKKLGSINLVGEPVTLSRTPSKLNTAAPEKGEHVDEILKEFGYDDSTIKRFKKKGIV